jgi:hypothetical protein
MSTSNRGLWLGISLLLSAMIGSAAGVLAWLAGDHPAKALIQGGAAFAATTSVAILAISFASSDGKPGRADRSRDNHDLAGGRDER